MLIRPGNGPEDYAAVQRFAIAFAQKENAAVNAIYPEDKIFVAETGNAVVGAIVAHKHDATHWEIQLLYVSGGFRGGTGRALLKALDDFAGSGVEIKAKATIGTQSYLQHLGWKPIDFLVWGHTT
jgi:hypothetical protein